MVATRTGYRRRQERAGAKTMRAVFVPVRKQTDVGRSLKTVAGKRKRPSRSLRGTRHVYATLYENDPPHLRQLACRLRHSVTIVAVYTLKTPHLWCGVFLLSVLRWRRPTLACMTTTPVPQRYALATGQVGLVRCRAWPVGSFAFLLGSP